MNPERMNQLLTTVKSLPPLPTGVGRLLSLNQHDRNYLEQASMVIRADPALAGQTIRIANSALYAGHTPVESLDRALMRVGVRMIVASLTSVHLKKSFDPRHEGMLGVWLDNLMAALIARSIAERAPIPEIAPETAYTYGLLHDVGRLVMVALFPNAMEEMNHERPHPMTELLEREREIFGFTHPMAGRLLGNRWKFPPEITLVIAAHHLPANRRDGYPERVKNLLDLVLLSNTVAHYIQDGSEFHRSEARVARELEGHLLGPLLDRLRMSPSTVLGAIEPSLRQMERQRSVLGLQAFAASA